MFSGYWFMVNGWGVLVLITDIFYRSCLSDGFVIVVCIALIFLLDNHFRFGIELKHEISNVL